MELLETLNAIEYHDGSLLKLVTNFGESRIELTFENVPYSPEVVAEKESYLETTLVFEGVSKLNFNEIVDFIRLEDIEINHAEFVGFYDYYTAKFVFFLEPGSEPGMGVWVLNFSFKNAIVRSSISQASNL